MMVAILLADGFETVEALAPADILRRAGIEVSLVGVDRTIVTSAQGVQVFADLGCLELDMSTVDMLVLPGGKGVEGLRDCAGLIKSAYDAGKWIAAICAAPTLLGRLLDGKRATCYPGVRGELPNAVLVDEDVVQDGRIITGKAAGSSMEFSLKLAEVLQSKEAAEKVRMAICL